MEFATRVQTLLEGIAQSGFGARKTSGYGHLELKTWQPETCFDGPIQNANAFISLSNWVPAQGDPANGFYNLMVKYGKLGEEFASIENPFKFPLTMLEAGSVFYTDQPHKEWYGRLVKDIAPGESKVVQYGFAFAVPAVISE